jgi:hypothetical protein
MIAMNGNRTTIVTLSTLRALPCLGARSLSLWRRVLAAALLLASVASLTATQSVSLTWDPSPDPRAIGYVLVYGNSSGVYNQSTNVGNVSAATVNGLVEGQSYCFAVYAYADNSLQSDFSNEVCYQVPSVVVSRLVFYNNSAWDNNGAGASASDDAAIATDKTALLPGQTASFSNYTSYSRGLNGLMVDIAGLGTTVTAADFAFKAGNDSNAAAWASAPAPSIVSLRRGAGVGGSDRITIIWPDNLIQGSWLQVTVRATPNTGLASPDVFYFGNAVGDAGNSALNAAVTSADALLVLSNVNPLAGAVTLVEDFNRDRKVTSADALIALNGVSVGPTALQLITASGTVGLQSMANDGVGSLGTATTTRPALQPVSATGAVAQILGVSTLGNGWTVASFHFAGASSVRVWQSTTLLAEDWQELPADWITAVGTEVYEVRVPSDQAGAHSFFRFSSDVSRQTVLN